MSMQNSLLLCYYLLIIVLSSIRATVNLLYPTLYIAFMQKSSKNTTNAIVSGRRVNFIFC